MHCDQLLQCPAPIIPLPPHDRLDLLELCIKINISSSCFWQAFCLTNQKNRQYREKGVWLCFVWLAVWRATVRHGVKNSSRTMNETYLVSSVYSHSQGGNRKWSYLPWVLPPLQWSTSSREAAPLKGSTTIPTIWPTGDHVFKHVSLWETPQTQTVIAGHGQSQHLREVHETHLLWSAVDAFLNSCSLWHLQFACGWKPPGKQAFRDWSQAASLH